MNPTDPQKELLDPALKGTRNVMGAVVKSKCGFRSGTLCSSICAHHMQATECSRGRSANLASIHVWQQLRFQDMRSACVSAAWAPLLARAGVTAHDGAVRLLGSAGCRDTVKRVVLTSSVAAVRSHTNPKPVNPPLYSDKDWNEVRSCAGRHFVSPCLQRFVTTAQTKVQLYTQAITRHQKASILRSCASHAVAWLSAEQAELFLPLCMLPLSDSLPLNDGS